MTVVIEELGAAVMQVASELREEYLVSASVALGIAVEVVKNMGAAQVSRKAWEWNNK